MWRILTIGLAVAGSVPVSSAPPFPALPPMLQQPEQRAVQEEVDFSLIASRMTVPVDVAGAGIFDFIVDTGAERTVISQGLAERLNLAPGKPVTMFSMGGVDRVDTVRIPFLRLNNRNVQGIEAPALNGGHLGAQGMLGVDMLQEQRVTFDFEKRRMTIMPSRRAQRLAGRGGEIVVTARSRFGRLVLVDARLDGQKVWVVVDTGSEVTVGNSALRRKLERKGRLRATTPIHIVSVMGHAVPADYMISKELVLGGVVMRNMPIAFADVPPFAKLELTDRPALLLGMDALRGFSRVSVDFAQRRMRFLLPDEASNASRNALLAGR